jgi:hypothetical protein
MPLVKNYEYCKIPIICIDRDNYDNFLTLNKEYYAYGMDDDVYYFFNDIGSPTFYIKTMFMTLKQHRKLKLEKLNEKS